MRRRRHCLDNAPAGSPSEDACRKDIHGHRYPERLRSADLHYPAEPRLGVLRRVRQAEKIVVIPTIVFAAGSLMAQEILNNLLCKPQLAGRILVVGMAGFYLEHVPVKPA